MVKRKVEILQRYILHSNECHNKLARSQEFLFCNELWSERGWCEGILQPQYREMAVEDVSQRNRSKPYTSKCLRQLDYCLNCPYRCILCFSSCGSCSWGKVLAEILNAKGLKEQLGVMEDRLRTPVPSASLLHHPDPYPRWGVHATDVFGNVQMTS